MYVWSWSSRATKKIFRAKKFSVKSFHCWVLQDLLLCPFCFSPLNYLGGFFQNYCHPKCIFKTPRSHNTTNQNHPTNHHPTNHPTNQPFIWGMSPQPTTKPNRFQLQPRPFRDRLFQVISLRQSRGIRDTRPFAMTSCTWNSGSLGRGPI